ncbi:MULTISPECIES: Crp/Fnr family transcriptional regulator [Clostridia]|uniref:Crp/Fnr family transcriptional regulator n=1 Tax=Clostridia TaxID=186801 RepID=UPI003F3B2F3D
MKKLIELLDNCPHHIKNKFSELKFDAYDKILLQNETSNCVYILKSGKVKVYSLTTNGIKYLDHIYCKYELFGELEVFLNTSTLGFVEALEPCDLIKITREDFLEWLKYDNDFSLYINIQLSQKMYNTCINSKANVVYPLKYRVLYFLCRFLTEHNTDSVHKDIVVEGIGSNIRSINRVVKDLNDNNIIEYNQGYIKVKNLDRVINDYL